MNRGTMLPNSSVRMKREDVECDVGVRRGCQHVTSRTTPLLPQASTFRVLIPAKIQLGIPDQSNTSRPTHLNTAKMTAAWKAAGLTYVN